MKTINIFKGRNKYNTYDIFKTKLSKVQQYTQMRNHEKTNPKWMNKDIRQLKKTKKEHLG